MRVLATMAAVSLATFGSSAGALADEYPADTTTTGQVPINGSASANIDEAGDVDWFAVELQSGQQYAIDLEGAPTDMGTLPDPYLFLFDGAGTELDWNDDGGADFNSRLLFTPPTTGTYYVGAGAFGSAVGTYTLTVAEYVAPPDDYPADATTTGRVTIGDPVTGEIEAADDVDWFAVDMDPALSYRIDLEGAPTGAGSLSDPYLYIFDANGNQLDWNDDGGEGFNSGITFRPPTAGTYYIGAGAFAANTGTYRLSVSEFVAPPDDYPADMSTAGVAPISGSVTGSIEVADDEDWFAVQLSADLMYTIDLEGSPTGGGDLSDPYLHVYDDAGNEIDWNDDGGEGLNSSLTFSPPYSGTFYIGAAAFSTNVGSYTLSVAEFVPPPDDYPADMTTIGTLSPGGSVVGEIEVADDEDWFAIYMEAGISYAIDLEGVPTGMGTLSDPYLYLYDEDGFEVAWDDDGGTDFNSRLAYTPDFSGTYYIGASAFSSATGTYTLSAEEFFDDYPDDVNTHGTLAAGGSVNGDIEVAGDADWFAIYLEAGTAYVFDLEGSVTGMGSLSDPYLVLWDAEGYEIDWNDDGGTDFNSRLTFTPSYSDTYYLSAEAYGSNTGTYTLSATVQGGEPTTTVVSGDNLSIVIEMIDGETLRLSVPRNFLSEIDTIHIGPDD